MHFLFIPLVFLSRKCRLIVFCRLYSIKKIEKYESHFNDTCMTENALKKAVDSACNLAQGGNALKKAVDSACNLAQGGLHPDERSVGIRKTNHNNYQER